VDVVHIIFTHIYKNDGINTLEAIYSLPVSLMAPVYRSHHSNQERAWVCISHCCPVPIFQSDSGSSAIFGVLCEDSYPRKGNASTYGLNITVHITVELFIRDVTNATQRVKWIAPEYPTPQLLLTNQRNAVAIVSLHSGTISTDTTSNQGFSYMKMWTKIFFPIIHPSSKVLISQITGWESIFCWVFFKIKQHF